MPTVEDYFDDDTDLPLPSSSSRPRNLPNTGHRGALLEEIAETTDDMDMDYSRLSEQSRGIFGENASAPPPSSSAGSGVGKGKMTMREGPGELRPTTGGPGGGGGGGQPQMNPNSPMGGFMGDLMRLQQAEDERMEKLRKQFGNASVAADPEVYKGWNTVYPLYFDAKVSLNEGRRVPRQSAIWWPQAGHIAEACRTLGLPSVLEPDRVHPADWENPGRVKIQLEVDGRFINPIVKNRTQLYKHLASQMRQQHPKLAYDPSSKTVSKRASKPASTSKATPKSKSSHNINYNPKSSQSNPKSKSKSRSKPTSTSKSPSTNTINPIALPTRPPKAPQPTPKLEDRLPLHSPVHPTGVAVASIKRDIESEKEGKKKGIGGGGGAGGGGEEGAKDKTAKMKRVVVRGPKR